MFWSCIFVCKELYYYNYYYYYYYRFYFTFSDLSVQNIFYLDSVLTGHIFLETYSHSRLPICSQHFLLIFCILVVSVVFSSESILRIRWPKHWSFGFSISPFNEYSRLISFQIDWFHLHVVQGTLKILLQHHSSKVSILWHSDFFMVQLSHPYMWEPLTIQILSVK